MSDAITRERRVVNLIESSFADDLAMLLRTRSVPPAKDTTDMFRCGSGGAGNAIKSESMTLTDGGLDIPGPGGCFRGEQPTYVPPGSPAGTPPSARTTWLRKGERNAKLLGVYQGPDARPSEDWDAVLAAFITNIRIWARHGLFRTGRQYVLGTHIYSRTWFLGKYRPPSARHMDIMDAAGRKFYWKNGLGDAGPQSPLTAFRTGNRVSRAGMAMDYEHGGRQMFHPMVIFTAMHAGIVRGYMTPVECNTRPEGDQMHWQVTGLSIVCDVIGTVAGLISHPDIRAAVRRKRTLSSHWRSYLLAWANIRDCYTVAPPTTYEEVQSMVLYDSREVTLHGRALPRADWEPVAAMGVLTVGDLWDTNGQRYWGAAELRILPSRLDDLQRCLPRAWKALLTAGRSPLINGEWVLRPPGCDGNITEHAELGDLLRVTAVLGGGRVMMDSYSITYSVGWTKRDAMVVTAADLIRATVETKGADGHGLVKLVGVTAHVYSRSVARMRQKTRRNATGCLSFYSAKKGARMMRGPRKDNCLTVKGPCESCESENDFRRVNLKCHPKAPESPDRGRPRPDSEAPTGFSPGKTPTLCASLPCHA